MPLRDAEFALFLLEDDLTAGTAVRVTQAPKNRSRQLLSRLQVVESIGADVDADDAAVSFNDNPRFGAGLHYDLPLIRNPPNAGARDRDGLLLCALWQ